MTCKGAGELGSWRTSGDHTNYNIVENGQNTKKSTGDLRRLAVSQTLVKDHQLTLMCLQKMKKNWKLSYTLLEYTVRTEEWNFALKNVPCSSWLTEWNYQITTKLKRSEKRKPTNTRLSWRLTPSNNWKWKIRSGKNISGELENYSRQNSPAETSSKEKILGLCPSLNIRDPSSSGPEVNKDKWIKEQEN